MIESLQFLLFSPAPAPELQRTLYELGLERLDATDAQSLHLALQALPPGTVPMVVFAPEAPEPEATIQHLLRSRSDCYAVLLNRPGDGRSLAERFQHIPIRASRVDLVSIEPVDTLAERLQVLGRRFMAQRAYRSVLDHASAKLSETRAPVFDLSAESVRRQLVESLPIGLLFVNADGYIVEGNRLAWTLLERNPQQAGEAAPHLSELLPQWENLQTDAARDDLLSFASRGQRRHIRVRAVPISSARGRIVTLENVTEHEQARQVLAAAAQQMEREAIRSAQALAIAEQERDSIKHFIATLTHDLRSPIAAAFVNSELLQRWVGPQPARVRTAVQRIQEALRRLDRMISNLLDLTRYDTSGELPIELSPVRLDELVRNTAEELAQVHRRRFDIQAPLPEVTAVIDADGIRRALENLLNNAVKYGEKARPISVRLEPGVDSATIHVRSFGPAMPAEAQRIVFEPFYRAKAPQNRGIPGWGIGLAFVRAITEAHGGSVSLLSSDEEGTVFSIRLPIAMAENDNGA